MSENEDTLYREPCPHGNNPIACLECDGPEMEDSNNDAIGDLFAELDEKNDLIESLRESIADLQKAIETHHEDWNQGGFCFSECATLCLALERLKARGHWMEEKK